VLKQRAGVWIGKRRGGRLVKQKWQLANSSALKTDTANLLKKVSKRKQFGVLTWLVVRAAIC
jgi:hypothetical protein